MSKARSPRWLCSITYGISGIPLVSGLRVTSPRGRVARRSQFRGGKAPVVALVAPRRLRGAGGARTGGFAQEGREPGLSALTVRRFVDFSPLGQPRKHLLVAQLDAHRLLQHALAESLPQPRRRGAALSRHLLDAGLDLGRSRRDRLGPRQRLEQQRLAHLALGARSPLLAPLGELAVQGRLRHLALEAVSRVVELACERALPHPGRHLEGGALDQRVEERAA